MDAIINEVFSDHLFYTQSIKIFNITNKTSIKIHKSPNSKNTFWYKLISYINSKYDTFLTLWIDIVFIYVYIYTVII